MKAAAAFLAALGAALWALGRVRVDCDGAGE